VVVTGAGAAASLVALGAAVVGAAALSVAPEVLGLDVPPAVDEVAES
jgi:hypothetical protein